MRYHESSNGVKSQSQKKEKLKASTVVRFQSLFVGNLRAAFRLHSRLLCCISLISHISVVDAVGRRSSVHRFRSTSVRYSLSQFARKSQNSAHSESSIARTLTHTTHLARSLRSPNCSILHQTAAQLICEMRIVAESVNGVTFTSMADTLSPMGSRSVRHRM